MTDVSSDSNNTSTPDSEPVPIRDTPVPTHTHKLFAINIVFVACVAVFVCGFLAFQFYKSQESVQYLIAQKNKPTSTPIMQPIPTPPPPKKWVLKKTADSTAQSILSVCGEQYCHDSEIQQWGDMLFYKSFVDQEIVIKSYNLKSGESKEVYNVALSQSDFGGSHLPNELSDMKVVGNTLFFSFGGYLIRGGLFYLDLPPQTKPTKILDSRNARISFWKNRYWIIGGEGDACWSSTDFSLLDIHAKQVKHVATSSMGCNEGEEYIEIDKRNRMLLAYHSPSIEGEIPADSMSDIYRSVSAVYVLEPSVKEGVIAEKDMPKNISKMYYLPQTDQLALVGLENYRYDFSSRTIEKVTTLPPEPEKDTPVMSRPVAEAISSLTLPSGYTFVLE